MSKHPLLSRRGVLGAAGAGVVCALSGLSARGGHRAEPARPAADPMTMQGAGFYRQQVGDADVLLVGDGSFPMSPAYPLFGANASENEVRQAFDREFIDFDHVTGHVNALLIRSGGQTVLVDSGCGSLFGPTVGRLVGNLARAGVSPGTIDAIVITHAHPDHIGGLLAPDALRQFDKAQFFAHADEIAFWTGANPDFSRSGVSEEMRGPMVAGAVGFFASIKRRLIPIEGRSARIIEGVTAELAAGHTPGHLVIHVASGSDQLLYITDAVHHFAPMMANPDWHVAYDTDLQLGAQTRRRLLERAASEKLRISGAHLPFPAIGHVRPRGQGFEWVPAVWEW